MIELARFMGIPDLRNKYKRPLCRAYLHRTLSYMRTKHVLQTATTIQNKNKLEDAIISSSSIKNISTKNENINNKVLNDSTYFNKILDC